MAAFTKAVLDLKLSRDHGRRVATVPSTHPSPFPEVSEGPEDCQQGGTPDSWGYVRISGEIWGARG